MGKYWWILPWLILILSSGYRISKLEDKIEDIEKRLGPADPQKK